MKKYPIGFNTRINKEPEESVPMEVCKGVIEPKKSVVQVYFPHRGMGWAYYNDSFDFSSADDYEDALNKAKGASVADVSEVNILPTSDTVADSHEQKKNIWRKFCTDGSKYGVNPEDFENADDYEEALKRAKDKINS